MSKRGHDPVRRRSLRRQLDALVASQDLVGAWKLLKRDAYPHYTWKMKLYFRIVFYAMLACQKIGNAAVRVHGLFQ